MKSTDLGRAPIEARGKTYWLTHHAAERALDMDVPIKLSQHILAHGKRHDAPPGSKYQGAELYRMGHVSVVVMPKPEGPTIVSVLWAPWKRGAQQSTEPGVNTGATSGRNGR